MIVSLALGVIAGLRALTAPAAASWAARLGWFPVVGTPLAFLGYTYTPIILTVLAVGELINDKLPGTPSRKVPPQFIARLLTGAVAGAAAGTAGGSFWGGLVAGLIGAVIGTFAGAALRGSLAHSFGKDLPAALVEDALAIFGSIAAIAIL